MVTVYRSTGDWSRDNGTMQSELFRLSTFSSFPQTLNRLYPSRLSRLGFYFNVDTGCLVCHRCEFSADLTSVDDERDLHRRHYQQSTICQPPPETRDVIGSRDRPTDVADAWPPATSTDAGEFF